MEVKNKWFLISIFLLFQMKWMQNFQIIWNNKNRSNLGFICVLNTIYRKSRKLNSKCHVSFNKAKLIKNKFSLLVYSNYYCYHASKQWTIFWFSDDEFWSYCVRGELPRNAKYCVRKFRILYVCVWQWGIALV